MDSHTILIGRGEDLPVFSPIVAALANLDEFPFLIEEIYREAMALKEDELDKLRFGLLRLQIYADIHRYEDTETTQKMKYVAEVLEKVLFGGLLLEGEESGGKQCC